MLIHFFLHLRAYRLPVSLNELLDLLRAIDKGLLSGSIDDFYQLARLILIKEEKYYDRFDVAFSDYLNGESHLEALI